MRLDLVGKEIGKELRRKILQFSRRLLRKAQIEKAQYCDDVKRNCSWAQGDRSELRGWVRYSAAMTNSGVRLHGSGTASTLELSQTAYLHL